MTFIYFGALSQVLGHPELVKLGQKIELTEELGRELAGSTKPLPIVPESLFSSVGFTPEDLTKYPAPADAYRAPTEFKMKRDLLQSKFEDWRRSPAPKPPAPEPAADQTPAQPTKK
jgi:hypothetical protein